MIMDMSVLNGPCDINYSDNISAVLTAGYFIMIITQLILDLPRHEINIVYYYCNKQEIYNK